MASKDIEKLREKVEKDPNSKLFVPLAEEYRKEGMLEEAIDVLLKGIEKQPTYMSARVSLGKIYLEKGLLKEAQTEFENVVRSIPDNLYAHKKLAELYRDTGERDLAIRQYRTVLRLNAMDEDAMANLNEIESGGPDKRAEEASPTEEPYPGTTAFESPVQEVPPVDESPEEAVPVEPIEDEPSLSEAPEEPAAAGDDLDAFKQSLFGAAVDEEILPAEELPAAEEETLELVEEEEEDLSFKDVSEALEAENTAVSEDVEEDFSLGEDFTVAEASVEAEEPFVLDPAEGLPEPFPGIAEADTMIAEGNYAGALNIYRGMLLSTPGDRRILQRTEDLKTLLKLMGKDKEALVARLTGFLESIRKRRDEFFRSS